MKTQEHILKKFGIEQLNAMQEEALEVISSHSDVVLLSPTGTGKTLAFLLPIIEGLDSICDEIQTLILVPSRELALQIENVAREMGTGYKINAVYGGRSGFQDKIDLKHRPAILIGTPGRVADRLRRDSFTTDYIKTLVLDEFDKSLEIGFESEMKEIIYELPKLTKRILTSATQGVTIPKFVGLQKHIEVSYLHKKNDALEIKAILSPSKDKLKPLVEALQHIGNKPGIIFCNFKDSIQRVSEFLSENNIDHGCFYGGLEQKDRERSLIKFRNGTYKILLATDLAARGIDVPEIAFIIHYHLPMRKEEFTHRNGRTARMNNNGTAYVLHWEKEELPEFIPDLVQETISKAPQLLRSEWTTLYISGGRRDKISKGDIAGLFFKKGNLGKNELGIIEIKPDCSYVSVHSNKTEGLIDLLNNSRLKKKKVRISRL